MGPMQLKLGELAHRAGVTPRTVRYYIAQGLLPSPGRLGPMTRYGREHLERLRLIRRLQEQRLSLAEIRSRLERGPMPTPDELTEPAVPSPMAMRLAAPSTADEAPMPAERDVWERISLAADLELHVRAGHDASTRRLVDEIVDIATRRRRN